MLQLGALWCTTAIAPFATEVSILLLVVGRAEVALLFGVVAAAQVSTPAGPQNSWHRPHHTLRAPPALLHNYASKLSYYLALRNYAPLVVAIRNYQ